MMTHSIRRGLQVTSADIEAIVRTSHLLSEGKTLDENMEANFLGASIPVELASWTPQQLPERGEFGDGGVRRYETA
jgi:hypothetical protein